MWLLEKNDVDIRLKTWLAEKITNELNKAAEEDRG